MEILVVYQSSNFAMILIRSVYACWLHNRGNQSFSSIRQEIQARVSENFPRGVVRRKTYPNSRLTDSLR